MNHTQYAGLIMLGRELEAYSASPKFQEALTQAQERGKPLDTITYKFCLWILEDVRPIYEYALEALNRQYSLSVTTAEKLIERELENRLDPDDKPYYLSADYDATNRNLEVMMLINNLCGRIPVPIDLERASYMATTHRDIYAAIRDENTTIADAGYTTGVRQLNKLLELLK